LRFSRLSMEDVEMTNDTGAAQAKLAELEAEVTRLRSDAQEAERVIHEAQAKTDAMADERELLLAKNEIQAAEVQRQQVAFEAGKLNEASARLRGLQRLLPEAEAALPGAACAAAEEILAGLEDALSASRARLAEGNLTPKHILRFVEDYRRAFSLRQSLWQATADQRHACLTFDLKAELATRGLLPLAPDYIQHRQPPPPLDEPGRALVPHLLAFKAAREQAQRKATAQAHATKAAEVRLDQFGRPETGA
jgi:hypothetical protein